MLNEHKFPPALECEALQIMHKVLLYNLPNLPCPDMLEFFPKLLTYVENVTQSPILLKRLFAFHVLVDISVKFIRKMETTVVGVGSTLASQVISFVIDRISLLVKPMVDLQQPNLEMEREVKSLFNFLLLLAEEHLDLGGLVLEKIYLFIKYLGNKNDRVIGTGKSYLSGYEFIESGREYKTFISSKLMLYVSRVVVSCLENIDKADALATEVHNAVKLLVDHVHQCLLFDCYAQTVYYLSLHFHITCYWLWNAREENNNFDRNLSISDHDNFVQHEILTLECAKKMMSEKDKWSAYKAGKYAACQGAWFTAAYIFEQLIMVVQSDSCHCWLKSMAQFAHSEMKVLSLLLPKQGSILLNWLQINRISVVPFEADLGETGKGTACKINSLNYIENLISACKILHSSEVTLGAVTSDHAFGFQIWFLGLRAKVLETLVDILKALVAVSFLQDCISSSGQVKRSNMIESPRCFQQVTSLVYRLKRLAQEFDLMATSFIGMNCKSLMIISALALSCSLLAFSSGFALLIPTVNASENSTVCGLEEDDSLPVVLIQDLVGRLWHIDRETSTKLRLLLKSCRQPKSCYIQQSRNHMLDIGYEARRIISVCSDAVTGVVGLQNEANKTHNDDVLSQITTHGLQLLLNIITKWMHIPFRTPNHFFQVRPCVFSQLFSFNGDGGSVMRGFHLSLNLCLQLKNMPPDLPLRLTKLYCILYCTTSSQIPCPAGESKGQTQDWGSDEMVDLNERLFHYVTTGHAKTSSVRCGETVEACVRFEAPNEKGQGFSTCLLDVSAFPVGCYRIKWHSCGLDCEGSYWSLLPSNVGPVISVQDRSIVG